MTSQPLIPIADFGFEPFERGLLAPFRHLLQACRAPHSLAWHRAFVIAAETWGETEGLAVAYTLWPVVRRLHAVRGAGFESHDPLDLKMRSQITSDELQVMAMLHYMRRNETALARDLVEAVTEGGMDVDLIRAGLAFADRFPSGKRMRLRGKPELRAVS